MVVVKESLPRRRAAVALLLKSLMGLTIGFVIGIACCAT
jgi:hypothetical protein